MLSKAAALAILIAFAEARFGQEQVPIPAISALTTGDAGEAATIAGAAISDLLGAANPCAKLQRGDQIIQELGTGADAVAAAIGMVSAEQNVNPFASQTPTVCDDPSLPASEQLRGITPLVDPAFDDAGTANALSAQSKANPLDATGKSILQLMQENGINNVKGPGAAAAAAAAAPAANNNQNNNAANNNAANNNAANNNAANNNAANNNANNAAAPAATSSAAAAGATAACSNAAAAAPPAAAAADNNNNNNNNNDNAAAAQNSNQAGTAAGVDFGLCTPTMDFVGGRANRPATEFTFLPTDPLVAQGQQEALNPNIITNRICDQLTNVCEANDAAKSLCADAKTQIQALGTRDQSTADAWNAALGFAGAARMMIRRRAEKFTA